ncbi:MAG: hypothetical protein ACRD68_08860 [Pyrinomonadaceae bacterium]
MAELIHQHSEQLRDARGAVHDALVYGERRDDGRWEGWIEFHPTDEAGPALRTGQETSQPNREALAYWASGLEAVYLEGAFARAR